MPHLHEDTQQDDAMTDGKPYVRARAPQHVLDAVTAALDSLSAKAIRASGLLPTALPQPRLPIGLPARVGVTLEDVSVFGNFNGEGEARMDVEFDHEGVLLGAFDRDANIRREVADLRFHMDHGCEAQLVAEAMEQLAPGRSRAENDHIPQRDVRAGV